ncbi:12218_t:CDS:2, partial [Funneliformis geosporum]
IFMAIIILGHELITDLDLPFEFEIKDEFIGSFNSQLGKVQYTLRANINRKPKRKKNSVEVLVPLCRWSIPKQEEMTLAILPQTFFDVNSETLVKIRLTSHNPGLRIRKISACVRTCLHYSVDDRGVIPVQREK